MNTKILVWILLAIGLIVIAGTVVAVAHVTNVNEQRGEESMMEEMMDKGDSGMMRMARGNNAR